MGIGEQEVTLGYVKFADNESRELRKKGLLKVG